MQKLNADLKNNNLLPAYLLHGQEDFLLKYFKKEFIKKFDDEFGMNLSIFNDDNFNIDDAVDRITTNPFFADKKLIVFDNINIFDKDIDEKFINAINLGMNVNVILFIMNADLKIKKNNLYKLIEEIGYILNIDYQTEENLIKYILKKIKPYNKQIDKKTASYLIAKVGTDLYTISNELDKIISYAYDLDVIDKKHIDAIATTNVNNNIWDLINAINNNNTKQVVDLYSKLISLNETSESIFNSIRFNYKRLMNVKDLVDKNKTLNEIIEKENLKLPRFVVSKIIDIARNTDNNFLYKKISNISKYTKLYKTGDIDNNLAVELLLV